MRAGLLALIELVLPVRSDEPDEETDAAGNESDERESHQIFVPLQHAVGAADDVAERQDEQRQTCDEYFQAVKHVFLQTLV